MSEFTPPPPQQGGKKREGPCTIAGCEKPARTRGMCNDHYQRWMKYGDPTAGKWTRGEGIPRDGKSLCPHCGQMVTRSTRLRHQRIPDVKVQGVVRRCSVEGCDGQVESRGYCGKYYARWKKYGDPLGQKYSSETQATWKEGEPFTPPEPRTAGTRIESPCLVPGCEEPVRSRGMCNKHHQNWLHHGDPLGITRAAVGESTGKHYPRVRDENGKLLVAHREIMSKILGRPLLPTEHVHHIDGNRKNNDPENLKVVTAQEHRKLHREEKTHCKNGHEFTPENTYRDSKGKRTCAACRTDARARYYAKSGR